MKKIAIIDDEHDILEMLEKFLNRSGKFEIDTFSNPKSILETLKAGRYDLVLLDIMMPELNGLNVLDEVKAVSPATKVIMMTAYSSIDKVVTSNKIGAEDYLTKPFVSLRDVENRVLDNLGL
jgi:DNA-binding NtrC family response regulator